LASPPVRASARRTAAVRVPDCRTSPTVRAGPGTVTPGCRAPAVR
jgi:hypothetical protein